MAMDALRAGIVVLVPLVRGVWWVYLWAFLLEIGGLIFLPARDASVPDLLEDRQEDLPLANGLVLGTSYGTIPLGAAAFGGIAALESALLGAGGLLGRPFLIVFLLDAATFLVSLAMVARLRVLSAGPLAMPDAMAPHPATGPAGAPAGGFLDALRAPLVRTVVPAVAIVSLGLGTLFSVGIVFVRGVLSATDAEFGVLVALFGVGAAAGLALLQGSRRLDRVRAVRLGVAAQGLVVAMMSLAPGIWVADLGAVAFGAATAVTLASGMAVLQTRLEGSERVLAFAAFHVVIRGALSLAALGAGLAVDLVEAVRWPLVGRLEPARVVLFCSGVLVFAGASLVRAPQEAKA